MHRITGDKIIKKTESFKCNQTEGGAAGIGIALHGLRVSGL